MPVGSRKQFGSTVPSVGAFRDVPLIKPLLPRDGWLSIYVVQVGIIDTFSPCDSCQITTYYAREITENAFWFVQLELLLAHGPT